MRRRTIETQLFGLGWPMRHRVVPNAATDRWCRGDPRRSRGRCGMVQSAQRATGAAADVDHVGRDHGAAHGPTAVRTRGAAERHGRPAGRHEPSVRGRERPQDRVGDPSRRRGSAPLRGAGGSPGGPAEPRRRSVGSRAIPYDPLVVTAPVVVILAAGQGTRMRSATPKLLHPLCGRPMIAWPVAAAREAGAGEDRRRRRARAACSRQALDGDASSWRSRQRAARDRRRRQAAARQHIDPDATVIVLNGDAPADHRRDDPRRSPRRTSATGAAATIADRRARRPDAATGASCARPTGRSSASSRPRRPGDATELELHIREINTGVFAFDGAAAADGARARCASRQRPGRALPARRAADPARARAHRASRHEVADPSEMLGINDRVALAQVDARSPSGGSTSGTCSPA